MCETFSGVCFREPIRPCFYKNDPRDKKDRGKWEFRKIYGYYTFGIPFYVFYRYLFFYVVGKFQRQGLRNDYCQYDG